MAKWKWREEKRAANTAHDTEVIDYGWCCADCGTDMDKYLSKSGYTHPVSMLYMKRNAPKLDYCPCCGAKKRDDGRA